MHVYYVAIIIQVMFHMKIVVVKIIIMVRDRTIISSLGASSMAARQQPGLGSLVLCSSLEGAEEELIAET